MKFTELNGCSLSMGSLYMPVVELEEEDHNVDAKLQDVKFKSINLLKVRDQASGEVISNCWCQAALLELEFLKEVDQCGYLYERQHIHRAIYR